MIHLDPRFKEYYKSPQAPNSFWRTETYDQDVGQLGWVFAADLKQYGEDLKLNHQVDWLDFGCGFGGPTIFLHQTFKPRSTTGIDINPTGIDQANELSSTARLSNLHFLASNNPFSSIGDSNFDAILCNDTTCHIPDLNKLYADFYRVLKPAGRVLVTDPLILSGEVSFLERSQRNPSAVPYYYRQAAEHILALQKAGFAILKAENASERLIQICEKRLRLTLEQTSRSIPPETILNLETILRLAQEYRLERFLFLAQKG